MILAIDIGNSTTKCVVMSGKKIYRRVSMTNDTRHREQTACTFYSMFKKIHQRYYIDEVIVCSVVPLLTSVFDEKLKKIFPGKIKHVGKEIKVPIKNHYRKPRQVGMDRLVCAYAVKEIYGYPAVIIDLGTAITIDVVSSRGVYEGGMILPGIRLSLESLHQRTALLPLVKDIKCPRNMIGKDTDESILSGVFFGYGAMCSGVIARLKEQSKKKTQVVGTGGYIRLMKKFIPTGIDRIDTDLIFHGLRLLSCQ